MTILNGTPGDDTLTGGAEDDTLNGADGNDTLDGGLGDDTLIGGNHIFNLYSGDRAVYSGNRDDYVFSLDGSGNGVISGAEGSDTLTGIVFLEFADDTYAALTFGRAESHGNFDGSAHKESIYATGYTFYNGVDPVFTAVNIIHGLGGDDWIDGNDGDDTLYGDEGYDELIGDNGNDTLYGGAGHDKLLGGNGDDRIDGGAYNDFIDGGSGSDEIFFGEATGGVTVDLRISTAQAIGGGQGSDSIIRVENVFGTQYADTITGNNSDNRFTGNGGDDVLDGAAGTDMAVFDGNLADYAITYDYGTLALTVAGTDGSDTLRNVEYLQFDDQMIHATKYMAVTGTDGVNTLNGTAFDDIIGGAGGNDVLNGLDGNDILDGGAGNDKVTGGAGTQDVAVFHGLRSDYAVFFNEASAAFTVIGPDGTDTVRTVEFLQFDDEMVDVADNYPINGTEDADTLDGGPLANLINGLGGNDTIKGLGGDDRLNGGAGNDAIDGGIGNDTIDGGAGVDELVFSGATGGITVNLRLTSAQAIGGGLGTDTISGIENISGTQYADTLTGGDGDNTLTGNAGNDTLDGRNGNDALLGGSGNDVLKGIAGNDALSGGEGDDALNGGIGDDLIDGGAGNDTAIFLGNRNQYVVRFDTETFEFSVTGHEGSDTLRRIESLVFADQTMSVGGYYPRYLTEDSEGSLTGEAQPNILFGDYAPEDNTEVLASDFGASLYGNGGDDFLHGNSSNESLYGGDGNDILVPGTAVIGDFGGGGDILQGGAGFDTAVFAGDLDAYTIEQDWLGRWVVMTADDFEIFGQASTREMAMINSIEILQFADQTIGFGVTSTTINGTGGNDDQLNGTGIRDFINGLGGNDIIDGRGGNDAIDGGLGSDTAVFAGLRSAYSYTITDAIAATVTVTGPDGSDTLTSVEKLQFDDQTIDLSSFLPINGTAGADTLAGTAGADVINGLGGNDVVKGGAGNDTLFASAGNDKLDGGNGIDTADFSLATARVIVSLADSRAQLVEGGNLDSEQLANIENLIGSNYNDKLFGDAGNNVLIGGLGADVLRGGGGADIFEFRTVAESTGVNYDRIDSFDFSGDDLIRLPVAVTVVETAIAGVELSEASFDTQMAAAVTTLGSNHAVSVSVIDGDLAGRYFLVVDANGQAGYQSGDDIVIRINQPSNTAALDTGDFTV